MSEKSNPFDLKMAFAGYLRAHFRNAVHVAYHYSVTERTAQNWMDGRFTPNGAAINQTWSEDPAGAASHLSLVVDNPPVPGPRPRLSARLERVAS